MVVSDASELLFEDIKKLNAQQRPDVPTCLIYAPISLLPMSTKHQRISTFLNSRTARQSSTFPVLLLCLSPANVPSNLQMKFNETETDTEFFSWSHACENKLCTASVDSQECVFFVFFYLRVFERLNFCPKSCPDPNTLPCTHMH